MVNDDINESRLEQFIGYVIGDMGAGCRAH